jgi:2-aminoadipate transaminase
VTEGFAGLRAWIAGRMSRHGRAFAPEDAIVTAGSQQGLDLVTRVLIDPGDAVLVEAPTYLAAIQVLRAAEARIVSIPTGGDGVDVAVLEQAVRKHAPKLFYLNPDHQSAGGSRLALERRG